MRYLSHSDHSLGMTAEPEDKSNVACINAAVMMDSIIGLRVALTEAFYDRPVDSPGVQRIEMAVNHLTLWLYGRLAFTGLFFRTGRKVFRAVMGGGKPNMAESEGKDQTNS